MEGYQKLKIYKKSYRAALAVYRMTESFPEREKYGITDQMRRASVSIALNIAEGYAKKESQAEFRRYLMMAYGSANEMGVLIDLSKDLEYTEEEVYEKAGKTYEEIRRMLYGLVKGLKSDI